MLTLAQIQAISQFEFAAIFENCDSTIDKYGEYEYLIGVANSDAEVFTNWEILANSPNSWRMGLLPYELKAHFEEKLTNTKIPEINFPEVAFFVPQCIILVKRGELVPIILGQGDMLEKIITSTENVPSPTIIGELTSNFSHRQYIETIQKLQEHIKEGDCYEINLAQRFIADTTDFSPADIYYRLRNIAEVPFAAFFKWKDQYLLSASPERFLKLKENTLISQPIKGTAPRGSNKQEDMLNKAKLQNSLKEQAENIMIVDLTRNDLYRSAEVNSVKVPYLFEVQSFSTVHQLVSTITAKKRKEVSWSDVIRNTFPPGSMTGAPKVRASQLIDRFENVARGIYAGSVGYISPTNDFDFNVVIRSLVYDDTQHLLSYHVGGAITYDSIPEEEYQETLLKAEGIRRVLGDKE